VLVTATALTARSIGNALRRFVVKKERTFRDYVVSGGGAKNQTLMKMLAEETLPLGLRLQRMEEYGATSEAKEALAFAVLAYQTWRKRPSNLPSATGARKAVALGKISLP
jgi:anhydro-N-acetylmuramic acid kinase